MKKIAPGVSEVCLCTLHLFPFDMSHAHNHYPLNNYRPQTKLRKGYVFTPVCHSVHRGGGICPSGFWNTPPWADTPLAKHPPGGDPAADGYCCGRYASYWNAFLLVNTFSELH